LLSTDKYLHNLVQHKLLTSPTQVLTNNCYIDPWTQALYDAALLYDRKAVQQLVLDAPRLRNLGAGSPICVRLPGKDCKEVDALSMTTGQLIEHVLTAGNLLARGADGRVVITEEMRGGAECFLSAEKLRVYEVLSLLALLV
jgi:hypothetical protein